MKNFYFHSSLVLAAPWNALKNSAQKKGYLLFFFLCLLVAPLVAQTTSWKGTASTSWATSSNWTNGIPNSTKDVIIGDANFTGPFQPDLKSPSNCKSLTIGNGAKVSSLYADKLITVEEDITIGANGTITSFNNTISLKGNWFNTGTYSPTHNNSAVSFIGTAQSINGATTFRNLVINPGSTTSLNGNITISKSFSVNGIFDPVSSLVTFSGGTSFTVSGGATLRVKAATFAGNYSANPSLNALSIVDYASSVLNQTIAVLTYGTLRLSGGLVKSLAGNTVMQSSGSTVGNVIIAAGTLDMLTRTLTRGTSTSGGSVIMANGSTLKIGSTNTFPANFASSNLATNSTVEYYGVNQTVSNQPYGNLILSSSSGAAVKTMPGTALTISNDFSSTLGSGSVSFTAAAAININGNLTIGASTTFNGGSFNHTLAGNWTNNGTFTGGTSTIIMDGTYKTIGGSTLPIFHNLTITGFGIWASSSTITITGDFATSGAGTFTHTSGVFTMSGTSKSISGTDISLNDMSQSGSLTMSSSILLSGHLTINGSVSATAGTLTMSGTSKIISGAGSKTLFALRITGTVSTAVNFSLLSDLSGSGTLTATAGTITFTGTSTFAGAHDLFNVTLNGTKLQLGSNSTLGIASTLTLTSGAFDVTSTVPNTVNYKASGSQNITATGYNNLTLSTSGTKTALGALTINNSLTINSGVTFSASSFTHTINGNWINSGTFTASSSTIRFSGNNDTSLTGSTTFNILTIDKGASSNYVALNNNISSPTLNMTTGELRTGTSSVTITSTRTGNGIILGTIIRTHAFSTSIAYAFEGPDNTITFTNISGGAVTSISVIVNSASLDDFPLDGSINRVYNLTVSNSGTYAATHRLHYEDVELNGNNESTMTLYRNAGSWSNNGKSSNSTIDNWVQNTSITNLNGRWTLSDNNTIAIWKGATSTAWTTASNWKSGSVPASLDIIQIGTEAFTNQPSISTTVTAKALTFGGVQAATLTLSAGGSLSVNGNIRGDWTGDATHTLNIGNQTLTTVGDLVLSNGNASRKINLSIGTGTVNLTGSLVQSGSAAVTFTSNGSLNIGTAFNYSGGSFTAGTGTVVYNGSVSQVVGAGITYYNLTFNKPSGTATFSSPITINGDLTLSTGGVFNLNADLTVLGNVTINSGVTVNEYASTFTVGGNWSRGGVFNSSLGTVTFSGTGNQTIAPTTFYNLIVNKTSGSISPTGNLTINGDLTVSSGTFDLATYTVSRSVAGGTFRLMAGTTLIVGGASNFPSNFNSRILSITSTVNYNGTSSQNVAQVTYGNLAFNNGGGSAKNLMGSTTIYGNITINSGASLSAGSYTITLSGNMVNGGTFIPLTGTVVFTGANKTLTGSTAFNNWIVTGSYTAAPGTNITISGDADLSGTLTIGTNNLSIDGNLIVSGTFSGDGTNTFTGTRLQTIRLTGSMLSPLVSSTFTFAGTVAPILNSTATPTFINVNISNTGAGISPSVDWFVLGSFNITAGAIFHGGSLTHTFYGPLFNNQGTVTSSGTMNFNPVSPYTSAAGATLNLGSSASFLSTGTVRFGGTRELIITSVPSSFSNVIVANTFASGVNAAFNWNTIGSLKVNSGSILNGGTNLTHILNNNISVTGTLNGQTSTIVMNPLDSVNYISGNGNITFHNLTIGGLIAATTDFNVSGNFLNNGIFDLDQNYISFTGSLPGSIGGSTSPIPLSNIIVDKTGETVTLARNLSEIGSLTIIEGTLDDAGFSITEESGGTLSIEDGGKLKIRGTNTLPVFTGGYLFDPQSTVEYAGTNQAIAVKTYGHLTLSNTGTKTLADGTTQATNVTNSSTFVQPNGSILQLRGDWINNGTFTANTGTVGFIGSATQNMSGSSVTTFNNISVTNTANPGVSVQSNQNLKGVLTLSSNVNFDADGTSNTAIFKLISTADDPTQDAAIAALPAGAQVTGNVTVQRFMSLEGPNNASIYRYISSPLQNATVADIQNEIPITGNFTGSSFGKFASMYRFNETVNGYTAFPTTSNTEMLTPGRGYAMYVYGTIIPSALWDVRGLINAGNVTPVSIPVTYTAASGDPSSNGWNLVGNPFPSTIDWNAPTGWTKTNIAETIYTRDNGNTAGRFAVWNGLFGINGGSRYIAMGQAIWVQTYGNGPILTANENVKSAGTQTSFFRQTGDPITNLLRIKVVKGSENDETAIHFRQGATELFDNSMDARKIMGASNNLSSLLSDGSRLAINSLPPLNCMATVKLALENVTAGSFRFDFSDLQTFSSLVVMTLKDKFLNTTFNISGGGSYTFSVTSNTASFGINRFEVIFSAPGPNSDFVLNSPAACENIDAIIQISNSQNGVSYVGTQNGVAVTASVIGNGNTINLTVPKSKLAIGQNSIIVKAAVTSCSLGAEKTVSINVENIFSASVQNGVSCGSGTVTLSASGAPQNGSYKWYETLNATTPIVGQSGATFTTPTLTDTKSYFVSAVNSVGCEGVRVSVVAEIAQSLSPQITESGGTLESNYNQGNQWYFNSTLIAGATGKTYEPKSSGTYRVDVSVNSCSGSTDYVYIITGAEEGLIKQISVYPNPVVDKIRVSLNTSENAGHVGLLSSTGQVISLTTTQLENGVQVCEFEMQHLPSGLYIVRLTTASSMVNVKVIKK